MLAFLLLSTLSCGSVLAQEARTGAPYVEAYAGTQKLESLPLAMTKADVVVAGVIADVSLTQVYENRGNVPIEAVYVFPASQRATVYALTMTVGGRVIRAKLGRTEEARKTYEAAKSAGQTATLLEQKDVGAFRMNVANVLPGDSIKVEMRYTELLIPTKGVYEFYFPNTAPVTPYSRAGDPDTHMPSSASPAVTHDALALTVRIMSAAPIASVESPSHKIKVANVGEGEALVTIDPADVTAAAKDFVLRYSMLGDDIGTGVLAYQGKDENFFLLTAQPPKQVGMERVPPREYIFVLDVSGSMNGRPMDVAKQLMKDLFAGLRPEDRLNVVLFAGGSEVLSESGSLLATPDTLRRALAVVKQSKAGGGTELAQALEAAYAIPKTDGMARSIVVVTDGGISAGGDVSRLVSSKLNEANLFAFGIGDYVDVPVIERIARAGTGEPFVVARMDQSEAEAKRLREYIERPVLTGIELHTSGADIYDLAPLQVPDLFAERPIVLVGKYRGVLNGKMEIRGRSGTKPTSISVDLNHAYVDSSLSSLPKLWARRRIDFIEDTGCVDPEGKCTDAGDDADARKEAVTQIALRYGLLSNYTSFVAVTEQVRTNAGATRVDQPVAAREVEEEAAPPLMASGYGFDPGMLELALGASGSVPSLDELKSALAASPITLDGHVMVPTADGWRDSAHRNTAHVLRIRRDSRAFELLMKYAPNLAHVLALPGRVLVSFGDYSILITPDGFSDYPEQTIMDAIGQPLPLLHVPDDVDSASSR
jgi:Ca-activated chloride channel family protein